MANIPTYTSKATPTTEPPAVYIKPAKVSEGQGPELAAKMIGSSMEQAGNIITKVADKMLQIQNANSESEANILTTQAMAVHEDEVNKNPDLNNALKDTPNKIQEMKKQGASKFVDPRARAEWERNFDLKAIVYQNTLKTNVDKRKVDLFRANTLREMDLESSNYINAPTPEIKLASRQKISEIMNNAVKMRAFTEEQGYDEVNKVIKSSDEVTKDLESLKRRKEKEIELAAKEAKNAREKEFIQLRIQRNAAMRGSENELVKQKVNQTNSLEDLIIQARKDMNAGRIDPKFAEAFINSCKTPKAVGAKTKSATFVKAVNDMLYNKADPKKLEIALMEANTAGAITDEDFDLLITFNQQVNEGKKLEQILPNVSFAKGLQYWGDENAGARDESKQRMFRNYMNKIKSGANPEVAADESIKEEILTLFPQVKNAPKEGIDIIDLNGVIKHITPDGELTVIGKEKKK